MNLMRLATSISIVFSAPKHIVDDRNVDHLREA